jgi:hypothetical protein
MDVVHALEHAASIVVELHVDVQVHGQDFEKGFATLCIHVLATIQLLDTQYS